MDEYDYLEAQLDGGKPEASGQELPPPPENGKKSSREKDRRRRSRSRDGKRSRSRSKERRRSSRSSSRVDRRERDRDRGKSRDRGKDYEREREKEKERGRERERDRERERPRRREKTPPEVAIQRQKDQEVKELERTVRTIMVMNLNLRAEELDIFDFFGRVGDINDIKIIRDKNTKRSKGIAYVEFATVESAINAISLNGQLLLNMPVLVKPSEAEKNLQWEAQQQAKQNQNAAASLLDNMGGQPAIDPIKLQILNLHPEISEEDLLGLFSPFGEVNYVKIVRDPSGASTGEAYVQYTDRTKVDQAIAHYNGYDIAGRKMTVQVAPVYLAAASTPMPPAMGGILPPPPGMGPGVMPPASAPNPAMPQMGGGEVDDLEEAENTGFRLNAQSRAALMSRLASSAGLHAPPPIVASGAPASGPIPVTSSASPAPMAMPQVLNVSQQVLLDQGLFGPASPIPTPCLLLKNMFTEADKADANWQSEVKEDLLGEASKFGEVVHCFPDPNSQGNVYLKFVATPAAEAACKAFHGRFYSGRQIIVSFQFLQPYNSFFGLR